ncbi:terminase large subunit [Sphingomonas sanxanigenens]|uniref:Terminase n=1 Tax=Sphingomonas sanxanigenens DSM 19645 = NX02 TaxID=1123269 RepID=W0A3X6_9SPHN|nr:terminase large subunit [Sphingomonas sanxanigenens]AHE51741.1 terminase [Sphingomonas sanxanigenens DSM 19645 = NX02]
MPASRATRSPATDTGHARDYAAIALAYAKRAAADKQQVSHCKWVRLAAQRHLDDLKRSRSKDWPYRFDPWHANDVCDFAEKLPHIEGNWCRCPRADAGVHLDRCGLIDLEPAQIFILAVVFGWRRKANGLRRFTVVYEEVARKNAKSTKTAAVSLYCLACENEVGPQVLTAATTFDQAKKVFHPAKRMVEKMPALQEAFGIIPWAKSITCADNGGYMQPLHAKSKTQDGHNPHLVTMDELHAHSDRGLYDVMRSAFGARKQPLLWQITTAGSNVHGVCYEQRTMATKVLERSVIAEHIFGIIFTLDGPKDFEPERKAGDDPYDERNWVKANPLLGAAVQLDELRQYAIEAQNSPLAEGEFKTKRLNLWIGAATAWLNVSQWIACSDPTLRLSDFRGLECFIGTDLSDKDDITAVVLAAIDHDGRLLIKTWFYLPEAVLKRDSQSEKDQQALYRQWHAWRKLVLTKGDFIDHRVIRRRIARLKKALNVRKAVGDSFAGWETMAAGLNDDFDDGTGFAVMLAKNANNCSDPAKDLEARVKAGPGQLRHDGNPVMTWMAGNVVVTRAVNGTILPKKEKPMSPNKIDGIDAAVNAMAPMQREQPRPPEFQMMVF